MEDPLKNLGRCLEEQLAVWPQAHKAFSDLENVRTRKLSSSGLTLQFNPARIVSTAAKVSTQDIKERPCFLCAHNRPEQQTAIDIGDGFDLLVNPYPILKEHFCAVSREHRPQAIRDCCDKLLQIAARLEPGYIVFYNGPRSGASAPDHLHMQIGRADGLPLIDKLRFNDPPETDAPVTIQPFGFPVTVIKGSDPARLRSLIDGMTILEGEYEPRLNVISLNRDGTVITVLIPRGKHRPDCYYMSGDGRRTVSPGAIDMCGLVITPRQEDFESLTEKQVLDIYRQVVPQQPLLKVGIMSGKNISFCLNDIYSDGTRTYEGDMCVSCDKGRISWNGVLLDTLRLVPCDHSATFTLNDVTIGIGFHWERRESQTFGGNLLFIASGDSIYAVNELPVEDYLASVISSEMKPTANMEFLKAHAVISRSWVLAQLRSPHRPRVEGPAPAVQSGDRIIKWYDHDQHTLFDVCADDHCQRYQGRTRIVSASASQAVRETFAETLVYEGRLCDARFSKCCGGVTELFETCWQNTHKPYLVPLRDSSVNEGPLPDLTVEENARKWILSQPKSFCNSADSSVLSQSLNGYDLETPDYYRWTVVYSFEELSELFARKSGLDIGRITDLTPVRRGPSARIEELQVTGSKRSVIIGKELEIRRTLSESHLFSSAFVVDRTDSGFILRGAGWGHGAGLCQIGAAVMGSKGYDYREILQHYYPGTTLGRFY